AIYSDIDDDQDAAPGFAAGGVIPLRINERMIARVNLGYATFIVEDSRRSTGAEVSTYLDDLAVDVEFSYRMSDYFYSIVGLSNHWYRLEFDVRNDPVEGDYTNQTTTYKYGFAAGLGYYLADHWNLEARYLAVPDLNQFRLSVSYFFKPVFFEAW
ncbi:outer membrane beta-barrel protein, partial [bacterium]|nr:outer membrane beta-barrel protein [bacterium]